MRGAHTGICQKVLWSQDPLFFVDVRQGTGYHVRTEQLAHAVGCLKHHNRETHIYMVDMLTGGTNRGSRTR